MSLNYILPRLEGSSFFKKFLTLLFVIAICLVVSTAMGFILAIPFFGYDAVMNLTQIDLNVSDNGIGLLKFFQAVNQIGVFIVPAIVFGYFVNRKPLEYLKISNSFKFGFLILALVLIVVSLPFVSRMVEINEQMRLPEFLKGVEQWMGEAEDKAKLLTNLFLKVSTIQGLLVNLLIIAFLASVGEELLFRGIVLRLFRELLGNIHLAVIFSAVLFSALHLQFYGFLPRTLLGVMFGYLFIWSGSMWVPVILHFVFNGISVVAAYLYEKGLIETDAESLAANQEDLIVIGSTVISIIIMILLFRSRERSADIQELK